MSLAVEEGVHEDEGGADHDQIHVGVEEEEDAEGEVLIFMFVADDFKSPIDWSWHTTIEYTDVGRMLSSLLRNIS